MVDIFIDWPRIGVRSQAIDRVKMPRTFLRLYLSHVILFRCRFLNVQVGTLKLIVVPVPVYHKALFLWETVFSFLMNIVQKIPARL